MDTASSHVAREPARSSAVRRPAWSAPVECRCGSCTLATISSATKPSAQTVRAAAMRCSRVVPAPAAVDASARIRSIAAAHAGLRTSDPATGASPSGIQNAADADQCSRNRSPTPAMVRRTLSSTGCPSRAYPMAKAHTSPSSHVPGSRRSSSHASTAAGTAAASAPAPGTLSSPSWRKRSGLAAAGADPCPMSSFGASSPATFTTAVMSPPGPLRCGSTTCSTNAAATAASKALPPRSSTAWPVPDASQWVEALMPNVPRSVGRVVNASGARNVTKGSFRWGSQSTTSIARRGNAVGLPAVHRSTREAHD